MTAEARRYPGHRDDERTPFEPYSAFDIPADLRALHGASRSRRRRGACAISVTPRSGG